MALRQAGKGYVLGVSSNHSFLSWGKSRPIAGTASAIAEGMRPADWKRLSAGEGTKGPRLYDWAYVELADLDVCQYGEARSGPWTRGLPKGFHRIRHYGLLASGARADNLAAIRNLLTMDAPASSKKDARRADAPAPDKPVRFWPCCGSRMIVIETFEGSCRRRRSAPAPAGIDTS
jgi:hypothetical protein